MKHAGEFKTFLTDEVNLDNSRIDQLTSRVDAIETFLQECEWGPSIQRFSPQGSWAHKTIIKPPGTKGFDADLLVFIDPVNNWEASDYLTTLRTELETSERYKGKLANGSNRCVTLEYAGDFQIDVVPYVVNRPGSTSTYEVCNKATNEFEATDSEAYTSWLEQRNTWTGTNKLREVTRLIKYLRDIKLTFSCKSILLTTLLGERISLGDSLYQYTFFTDLPTALHTLMGRLDDYLQARPQLHEISNPALRIEKFTRHWDEDKYANFREMIHKYRSWIDAAYDEPDEADSITKWQRVFGDEFARGNSAATQRISKTALVPLSVPAGQDAVSVVQTLGPQALRAVSPSFPWVKPPQWTMAQKQSIVVKATAHRDRSGQSPIADFQSGQLLSEGIQLCFEARMQNGLSYASKNVRKDYSVQWQVVNTDTAAWRANGLRGGFYESHSPGVRWESTRYRGIHWVEAFAIRRRDGVCVGRSGRFFVVIE